MNTTPKAYFLLRSCEPKTWLSCCGTRTKGVRRGISSLFFSGAALADEALPVLPPFDCEVLASAASAVLALAVSASAVSASADLASSTLADLT